MYSYNVIHTANVDSKYYVLRRTTQSDDSTLLWHIDLLICDIFYISQGIILWCSRGMIAGMKWKRSSIKIFIIYLREMVFSRQIKIEITKSKWLYMEVKLWIQQIYYHKTTIKQDHLYPININISNNGIFKTSKN